MNGSASLIAGAVVLILCVVPSAPAVAGVGYGLVRVLDDSGQFASFDAPVVNQDGTMAFTAVLDSGVRGIYTVTPGGSVTAIAENTGAFNRFFSPTINSSGQVAFYANLDSGGNGVYLWDGTSVTTIADNSAAPFLGGYFGLAPWVNDSGTVAFGYSAIDGLIQSIHTRHSGGSVATIVESSGQFYMFSNPSINSAGRVAFWARLDDGAGAERGIYAGSAGGPIQKIRGTDTFWSFPGLANGYYPINDGNDVAFYGSLDVTPDVYAIYVSDGGPLDTAVDTAGPFSQLLTYCMNDDGVVAFQAWLDAGGEGVFTGPDPVGDKVVAVGDTIAGTTVVNVWLSRQGINDSGQVVFSYSGSAGIVLGTPVPEPGIAAFLALSGLALIRRRHRS